MNCVYLNRSKTILLSLTALLICACGETNASTQTNKFTNHSNAPTGTQSTQPLVSALWEQVHPAEGPRWSGYAYSILQTYGTSLIAGPNDIANFCPNYASLDTEHKISFWVFLVSAIAKYESGFDPTLRFREAGQGTDAITHQPVYSEGLLQLSYQDVRGYSFCNEFDWSKDKLLTVNSPLKTIFDPNKNLSCGIRILNEIVTKKNLIAFNHGQYWSTLMPARGIVAKIKVLTSQIAFCRK